jgi:DNA-binding GntR family transcriptional regulator
MSVTGAQLPPSAPDGSGPVLDQPFGYSVPAVYEQLRALILAGKIAPGKATSQSELCSLTGASRTPVREALRMLQNEGLVVLVANRRMRIADISVEELEGLQTMRIALEGLAIRYTVGRLKREQLAELEGLMDGGLPPRHRL